MGGERGRMAFQLVRVTARPAWELRRPRNGAEEGTAIYRASGADGSAEWWGEMRQPVAFPTAVRKRTDEGLPEVRTDPAFGAGHAMAHRLSAPRRPLL